MKKCRCSNGKYSVRCCKSQGVRTSASTPKAYTPKHSTYGTDWAQRARLSGAASRRMSKIGNIVENLGKAQLANSVRSMPASSRKIWTPYMRHEVMRKREAHYGAKGAADMRKNPRKYDFRPKKSSNYFAYKDTWKRKTQVESPREAHRQRSPHYGRVDPNPSPYSVPTEAEISKHRRSQARRGYAKIGVGKSMKVLGNGLLAVQLGTYAWWLYQDPSDETAVRIVEDATMVKHVENTFLDIVWQWAPEFLPGSPQ